MRATTFLGAMLLGATFFGAAGMAMLLPLTGAQAQFWHTGPEALVWHGNDTGGIIPWSCDNEAIAQQAAAGYCARFKKYARITVVNRQYGAYISFNCLWSPSVDRYARPAVAMRTACVGQPQHIWAK
jgi:hypothetical protein